MKPLSKCATIMTGRIGAEFLRAAWERSTGAGGTARLCNDPRSIPLRAMLCLDPVI